MQASPLPVQPTAVDILKPDPIQANKEAFANLQKQFSGLLSSLQQALSALKPSSTTAQEVHAAMANGLTSAETCPDVATETTQDAGGPLGEATHGLSRGEWLQAALADFKAAKDADTSETPVYELPESNTSMQAALAEVMQLLQGSAPQSMPDTPVENFLEANLLEANPANTLNPEQPGAKMEPPAGQLTATGRESIASTLMQGQGALGLNNTNGKRYGQRPDLPAQPDATQTAQAVNGIKTANPNASEAAVNALQNAPGKATLAQNPGETPQTTFADKFELPEQANAASRAMAQMQTLNERMLNRDALQAATLTTQAPAENALTGKGSALEAGRLAETLSKTFPPLTPAETAAEEAAQALKTGRSTILGQSNPLAQALAKTGVRLPYGAAQTSLAETNAGKLARGKSASAEAQVVPLNQAPLTQAELRLDALKDLNIQEVTDTQLNPQLEATGLPSVSQQVGEGFAQALEQFNLAQFNLEQSSQAQNTQAPPGNTLNANNSPQGGAETVDGADATQAVSGPERANGQPAGAAGREVRIVLNPESLGTVRIRMHQLGQSGKIAGRVVIDNTAAASQIRQQLGSLSDSLAQKGITLERLQIVTPGNGETIQLSGEQLLSLRDSQSRGPEGQERSSVSDLFGQKLTNEALNSAARISASENSNNSADQQRFERNAQSEANDNNPFMAGGNDARQQQNSGQTMAQTFEMLQQNAYQHPNGHRNTDAMGVNKPNYASPTDEGELLTESAQEGALDKASEAAQNGRNPRVNIVV
ncbi:MAG: flagellar hook-length control protein FliK [Vampirovibrionales bacterium]|nr:flagellar hook-length control protein FliK [Vampirovibrionales bacterium]